MLDKAKYKILELLAVASQIFRPSCTYLLLCMWEWFAIVRTGT